MAHSSNLPSFDALQAVLAADRTGSFSAAAEELDLTHGAISRRVASIERWAGVELFERHGRGVRLFLKGQRFVRLVEHAFDILATGAAELDERRKLQTVRVSVLPSFARLWLVPNLSRLEGEPPDLRVELQIDHRFAILGGVDVAVRYGRGDWRNADSIPLCDEFLTPAASPELADAIGSEPAVDDLLAHPLIHDAYPDAWRMWLGEQGCRYRPRPQDRSYPDFDLGLIAAASGCGIALLREPYGNAFVANDRLRRLSSRTVRNPLRFYAVTVAGPQSETVRLFTRRLKSLFSP